LIKSFLFIAVLCGFFSCHQANPAGPAAEDADYQKAKSFTGRRDDSAFYYFNKVAINAKNRLQKALAYNHMGLIQEEAGDNFGSQESLTLSLKFMDTASEKGRKCRASDYNELGLTSLNLKNTDAALGLFDQALQVSPSKEFTLIYQNNQALAYQQKRAYARSIRIYEAIRLQTTDPAGYARVLSNLAAAKWLRHPGYNAAPDLLKALRIRRQQNDEWGLNSSYAYLADYYTRTRPDSALRYSEQMYAIARKLNSPDDQLEALQKLAQLNPPPASKAYFNRYITLNDSLQTARNAARNQFALIRYNAEKSKADNLILQQENSRRKLQLLILLIVVILGSAGFYFWYRKRKQRMAEAARLQIAEDQRKTSKKVHDTLGNDVYRIMKKVQHDPVLDKEWLLYTIDDVYQRARDISYDIVAGADENFKEKIADLLMGFSSDQTNVVLVGNTEKLWEKVDPVCRFELKYILQELMVNMEKHSGASNVVIKFEERNNCCVINYSDDGAGMPEGTPQKNGLTNTGNRIQSIGGEIIFGTGSGKGLDIRVSFPTA
jgi:signal transduction histidine kinase